MFSALQTLSRLLQGQADENGGAGSSSGGGDARGALVQIPTGVLYQQQSSLLSTPTRTIVFPLGSLGIRPTTTQYQYQLVVAKKRRRGAAVAAQGGKGDEEQEEDFDLGKLFVCGMYVAPADRPVASCAPHHC